MAQEGGRQGRAQRERIEGGDVVASFAKFASIFAITQIPLAISEGLLTVLIFNALMRFNARELQDLQLVRNDEVRV